MPSSAVTRVISIVGIHFEDMDKESSFNYSSIPASSSFPSQKELKKKQSLCSSSGYSSFPSSKPLHAWNSLDSEDKHLIADHDDIDSADIESADIATCSTVDEDSAATLATVESTFENDSTSSDNDSDIETITSAFGSEDEVPCTVAGTSASGSHSSQVPGMNLAQYTNEILWHFLSLERYNPSSLKKGMAASAAKSDSETMLVPPSSPTPAEHEIELADQPPTDSTCPAEAELTDVPIKKAKRKHRHRKKRRRLRRLLSSSLNLFHRCFRSPETNSR